LKTFKKEKEFLVFGIIFIIISITLSFSYPSNVIIYQKIQMSRDVLIRLGLIFSLVGTGIINWKKYKKYN